MTSSRTAVTFCIGRSHYTLPGVEENCTLEQLKKQLGEDAFHLGEKLLYASKLQCRLGPPPAPLLKESDKVLPCFSLGGGAGAVLHVGGPAAVTKSLELLLKRSQSMQVPPKSKESADSVRSSVAASAAAATSSSSSTCRLRAPLPDGASVGTSVKIQDPISGESFFALVSAVDVQRGYFDCEAVELRRAPSSASTRQPSSLLSLTDVMAAPLEEAFMQSVLSEHPDFPPDTLPSEACWWTETRFRKFVESGGTDNLSSDHGEGEAPGPQTRRLLQTLRLMLAERKVTEVDDSRQALCQHFRQVRFSEWLSLGPQEARALQQLSIMNSAPPHRVPRRRAPPSYMAGAGFAAASSSTRQTGDSATAATPFVLGEAFGDRHFVGLTLDALKTSSAADVRWICSSHMPLSPKEDEQMSQSPRLVAVATLEDYIDYMNTVASNDPFMRKEDAVAYPRVHMESVPLFSPPSAGAAAASTSTSTSTSTHSTLLPTMAARLSSNFQASWKDFVIEGLDDLTLRWVQLFADELQLDWLEALSRFFTVSLAAPGCVTRLHRSNNAAHSWLHQVEGRQLYVLYAPGDAAKLYMETLSSSPEMRRQAASKWRVEQKVDVLPSDWKEAISTADLFSPARGFPEMDGIEAWATVLELGETLVIPSGWSWSAVALENSVVLQHHFYNRSNYRFIVDDFQDSMSSYGDRTLQHLLHLKEVIAEDAENLAESVSPAAATRA